MHLPSHHVLDPRKTARDLVTDSKKGNAGRQSQPRSVNIGKKDRQWLSLVITVCKQRYKED